MNCKGLTKPIRQTSVVFVIPTEKSNDELIIFILQPYLVVV